jgi:aminoglycoside phosphotransferase (APT) family kinase protein
VSEAAELARLTAWGQANIEGFSGPVSLTRFAAGQSNPTFRLETPGKSYVLRRQPLGPLLKGAHALDREAKVMQALGKTGFPVPRVYGLCQDREVLGSWFYVMELVEGRIYMRSELEELPPAERAPLYDAMNATIAKLHALDPAAIGLGDYGRPENFLTRQISRWGRQYQEDTEAGRNADMDFLLEWLPANLPPEQKATIIHGDYRIDNLIFAPKTPQVAAVLDWELSTIGDPLADFTYHLMMYRLPPEFPAGLAGADLDALGLPDEESYVRDYCRRTGRQNLPALNFYIVFNMFRFAAILHGIIGRIKRGNAASTNAAMAERNFAPLAARAASLAKS